MKVLKFGGTSVASAENISKVVQIVQDSAENSDLMIVVSALGGITDQLLQLANTASIGDESYKTILAAIEEKHLNVVRELIPIKEQSSILGAVKKELNLLEEICEGIFLVKELSEKTQDRIVCHGELLSSFIITAKLISLGLDAQRKDSRELIITDSNHGNAQVHFDETNQNITAFSDERTSITVLPGFVASTKNGNTSTLGRGGSDYTAAIIAGALSVKQLEIWTDVSGMMTANPKLVKHALPIEEISYQEAMELSHFGAKVIYPPTIQPAFAKKIPILVKNTFDASAKGTLISDNLKDKSQVIKGISSVNNIALISLEGSGMIGVPGYSKRLFEALALEKINTILITQGSSEHSITVGISNADVKIAQHSIEDEFAYELSLAKIEPLSIEEDLAVIALVGDRMKSSQGVSGKMFSALGANGVNVRAIAQGSSEKNISAVIEEKDVKKALNVLHERLFQTDIKQINLFLTGVGNVGGTLLNQIKQQQQYLKTEQGISIRVIGIANSKKMLFNSEDGINLDTWKDDLSEGEEMTSGKFIENVLKSNLRNSVFVDNTASAEISSIYQDMLSASISVVTCNKIACSAEYENYCTLKAVARKFNASFLFETNVGAGLPIISTLNDLVKSGDRIRKIEAVLSGSLNFIFNSLVEGKSFLSIVKLAKEEGYTEPDPRIDLSGVDVMRKILILARESGMRLELDDIENVPFMPENCLKTDSVDEFLKALDLSEEHFERLRIEAETEGKKLKYVASLVNGKAKVGLEKVSPDQPYYNLDGKDNIVLFTTDRYPEQPLIIKGAGAGAEVTASGIFADIIRTVRN